MRETPPSEHPGHEPLVEEPDLLPPHAPDQTPIHDPPPQEEKV